MTSPTLSTDRRQQVDELLQTTLKRPRACPGDSELRRELESLIAADSGGGSFKKQPVHAEAEAVDEQRTALSAGQQLGPYKLYRELGHGGMGAVYLAARVDDEYRQQVSVKLVKPGLDSDAILRRFRNERQILASLDHPNIAKLLDGGTTDTGLPYFVMEYIEGEPIDKYCDRHKLSIDQRLELFRTVCSAVHAAHQNLVVHRDIKPGNILVTADGVPKLLDFGIAKLLNPELSAQTIHATGVDPLRLMTPAYASPEQIRGGTITTATDVYSLGVLLYELLTGHRPYRFDTRRPQEIERVVCETEPEKPSTAVRRALDTRDGEPLPPEQVSRLRGGRPEGLRRRLKGDLDNVVMMAMRKEPRRRYASALELAEDLRRHRHGLPVTARHSTFSYRAGKFARRHRWGVAFIGLLAAFAVAMAVQMVRLARERDKVDQARQSADRERQAVESERKIAERERERAEQVSGFLVNLFEIADPSESRGKTVTAREILDKGAETIDRELSDEPEVRAMLMQTMGKAYLGLGLYRDAEPLFESVLDIRRRAGRQDLELAQSLSDMALLLRSKGDYGAAEERIREALALHRRLLGEESLEAAASLQELGSILRFRGDYDGAADACRKVLAIRRSLLGDEHPDVAAAMNNLAIMLEAQGDYEAAEPLYGEALSLRRRKLGEPHLDVAASLNNLARVYYHQGDYAGAEPLFLQALEMLDVLLESDEHPAIAIVLNNLAELLQAKGDLEAAESRFRESVMMRARLLGRDHPKVAAGQIDLAGLLVATGDLVEAESLTREALASLRRKLPANHWLIQLGENTRGAALSGLERYAEAEPLLLHSYPVLRAEKGARSPHARAALSRLVVLYEAWGRDDRAEEYRALVDRATSPESRGS